MDRHTVAAALERRRASRRQPGAGDPLGHVRLRTGQPLAVVNVSNAGAFVEGTVRLLPGARIDMHLIGARGRVLIRTRVVRAFVSHLEADMIRYRGAVAFDQPVDTATTGYSFPAGAEPGGGHPGTVYSPQSAGDGNPP